jgi:hypothetical protein
MPDIKLINPFNHQPLQPADNGLADSEGIFFPYKNGAYRFVKNDNYTGNFGCQWNKFVTTQVGKSANIRLTQKRFFVQTNWDKEDLSGKKVSEVGSGAGRFSQIVLDHAKAEFGMQDMWGGTVYEGEFRAAVVKGKKS